MSYSVGFVHGSRLFCTSIYGMANMTEKAIDYRLLSRRSWLRECVVL